MTFRQYLFRLKWRFGVFILMYGLEISALTAVSIFTGNMITALTQFKVNAFVTAAIVMVVATIFQLVMQTLTNIYQVSLQRRLNNDIRTEITKSIAAMPFEQYHARSDAVYTSWMTNDVNTINTQGLRNVGYLIQASWQVVLSIFVLLTYQAPYLWRIGVTSWWIGCFMHRMRPGTHKLGIFNSIWPRNS